MTVKDIFDLRKQGKIEEAYEAIRPMYAVHKGKYTSLCMFWTAADIFKKRMEEGRTEEARKIFEALKRVLPYIKDNDPAPAGGVKVQAKNSSDGIPSLGIDRPERSTTETAAAFMRYASRRLSKFRKDDTAKQNCDIRDSGVQNEEKDIRTIREIRVPNVPQEEFSESYDDDISGHLIVGFEEGIIRQPERLNIPQLKVLQYITIHPGASVSKISEGLNIPSKSVERHIAVLSSRDLIEHRGSKKTGGYYTPERE